MKQGQFILFVYDASRIMGAQIQPVLVTWLNTERFWDLVGRQGWRLLGTCSVFCTGNGGTG